MNSFNAMVSASSFLLVVAEWYEHTKKASDVNHTAKSTEITEIKNQEFWVDKDPLKHRICSKLHHNVGSSFASSLNKSSHLDTQFSRYW